MVQSFLWLLYGGMHGKASHFYATVVQCYIDLVSSEVIFWPGGHLLYKQSSELGFLVRQALTLTLPTFGF